VPAEAGNRNDVHNCQKKERKFHLLQYKKIVYNQKETLKICRRVRRATETETAGNFFFNLSF
jgi:hypothetical protein